MNAYPAMRATQGSRECFVVKMCIKELVKDIRLAYEFHGDKELDGKIHHNLIREKLLQKTIDHIAQSEIHILNSLVVISIGGDPRFSSVEIEDSPELNLIGREEFNDTFGIISFNGKQKFYVVKGYEELVVLKAFLDRKNRCFSSISEDFENEEIPVVMVVFRDKVEKYLERYKQVHSNMKRLDALAQVVGEFFESSGQPSKIAGADEGTPDIKLARDSKS